MVYGQIAECQRINAFIYLCFEELPEEEQRKFIKQFREQPHDQNQVMHTLAELVCGAYLSSKGYRTIHDYHLNSKKPDWCILDDHDSIQAIIEVVTLHIDQVTKNYIEKQKESKRVMAYWRDGNANNKDRLYERIQEKAQNYIELVNSLAIPYIIAVYLDFQVSFDFDEVNDCLISKDTGLFESYPFISGVLYFEGNDGQYAFRYISNQKCPKILNLPEGNYP